MEGVKTCNQCNQSLPLTDYYRTGRSCKKCYRERQKRAREQTKLSVKPLLSEHKCTRCKQTKAVKEFHKNAGNKSGYCQMCKVCTRVHGIASYYKTTTEHARELLSCTCCEICKRQLKTDPEKKIDHNHETGKIRGVLCDTCNLGLGCFRDNITFLANAVLYLNKNE